MVMDAFQIPDDLLEQEMQRRTINNALTSAINNQVNNQQPVSPIQGAINTPSSYENNLQEAVANAPVVDRKQEILNKVKGGLADISAGYQDNIKNDFSLNNLQADPNKSGWNRFGEALGTGARLLGNPALQGALAGAIYGKYKGDALEGLKYGFDWAQNKAKSDYYAKKLGKAPGILGGYGKEDYNADVLSQYRETMADNARLKTQAQLDKTNPKMQDYADTMLASGLWDEKEYNAFVNSDSFVPDSRLNMNVVKEMTNKAYKEKDIDLKTLKTNGQLQYWIDTIGVRRESNAIRKQGIANSKTNSDRNYNLKKEKFEWEKEHPKGNKGGGSKQSGTLVKVIAPNGQTGTIPIGNLEAATKAGYKVAN